MPEHARWQLHERRDFMRDADARKAGIARDGRHLYPAFPYTAYTRMSDDDLNALYAYLMSLPAKKNEVVKFTASK